MSWESKKHCLDNWLKEDKNFLLFLFLRFELISLIIALFSAFSVEFSTAERAFTFVVIFTILSFFWCYALVLFSIAHKAYVARQERSECVMKLDTMMKDTISMVKNNNRVICRLCDAQEE